MGTVRILDLLNEMESRVDHTGSPRSEYYKRYANWLLKLIKRKLPGLVGPPWEWPEGNEAITRIRAIIAAKLANADSAKGGGSPIGVRAVDDEIEERTRFLINYVPITVRARTTRPKSRAFPGSTRPIRAIAEYSIRCSSCGATGGSTTTPLLMPRDG